jgi:hypothetical protein
MAASALPFDNRMGAIPPQNKTRRCFRFIPVVARFTRSPTTFEQSVGDAMRANIFPRHQKICADCGADVVNGCYCGACSAEAARRTMADIASFSHLKPKSKKEKTRISKVLSNHAVANTWWDPSSLPSWLTEECYVQRIQPLLKTKKVREIAAAIQVSELYAGFIRSGRRRPHPRHWQLLAQLVGIPS